MVLHELFFDGLGDESAPDHTVLSVIIRDFGSFERWRAEFMAMGKFRFLRIVADAILLRLHTPRAS